MSGNTSRWMNEELALFRKSVREFLKAEFVPHEDRWREQHRVDRETWTKAGATASSSRATGWPCRPSARAWPGVR